jgi:hypothetical protein
MRSICVILLFLAAIVPAQAQTNAPVRLDSCSMLESQFYQGNQAHVAAVFSNLGNTAADWIDFRVWWADGSIDTVHDVGTFAPGQRIKHTWEIQMMIREVGPALWYEVWAYPSRVHYADGSEWQSPYARLFDDEEFAKEKPSAVRCKIYPI